ncbi:OB-fold domain-containing protein [Bosea sp. (in: a-proteobacteria)]|uniref:Zn-ribbon domain-containing OB-fold protein n=1 Tax=Bosea sp. (in: a-proteobacteria) TaxID=1871050 RepID=UPI0026326ECA|nr:OB-fold domain-containing protein [Bosea sp. (in: a-proteobacteria)]MCO5089569.1 OB-fold domain-containing protein [Bosea sp. (in: a-proteobacteria)]
MKPYDKPLPKIDALNAPYWEGAKAGELRIQACGHCGRHSADPARLCMSCGSPELSWVAASGRARLWSFGIFHKAYFPSFAPDVPYNVAIVELEEGPRLYSNIVGVANDDIKVGMPLKVHFEAVTDGVTLVKFAPAPDGP